MDAIPPRAANTGALVSQFASIEADLAAENARFAQWQSTGHTYPDSSVSTSLSNLSTRLSDARDGFHDLHLDSDLDANLAEDVRTIAFNAGETYGMAQHDTVFGNGWANVFSAPIQHVQSAIQLLTGSARA